MYSFYLDTYIYIAARVYTLDSSIIIYTRRYDTVLNVPTCTGVYDFLSFLLAMLLVFMNTV